MSSMNCSSLISPLVPYLISASLAMFLIMSSFRSLSSSSFSLKMSRKVRTKSEWLSLKSLSQSYARNRNFAFCYNSVWMWKVDNRCKNIYSDIFFVFILISSSSKRVMNRSRNGCWERSGMFFISDSSRDLVLVLSNCRKSFSMYEISLL